MSNGRKIAVGMIWLMAACNQSDESFIAPDLGPLDMAVEEDSTPDLPKVDAGTDTDADANLGDDSDMDIIPPGPWRSALYQENWLPTTVDEAGRGLHDFSYAGFRRGEAPWKDPEPYVRLSDFEPDPTGEALSTSAFKGALAALENGGTLVVDPGIYRVDEVLEIQTPGVLIQGNGRPQIWFSKPQEGGQIRFEGKPVVTTEVDLTRDTIKYTEVISVSDVSDFSFGDRIYIGQTITPEFLASYGMEDEWAEWLGDYQVIHRRTVFEVDEGSSTLRLDIPIRQVIRAADGAKVQKILGELDRVGVRSIDISTAARGVEEETFAVSIQHAYDGLIDEVNSFEADDSGGHLAGGGLLVMDSSSITVSNSRLSNSISEGLGSLVEVRRSNEILVSLVNTEGGAPNFGVSGGFGSSGNVWLRVESAEGQSQFDGPLATANLVDASRLLGTWSAETLPESGPGCEDCVFWNTRGSGTIRTDQFGWGYVIGTTPEVEVWRSDTTPLDWLEGQGRGGDLVPSSLYEDQRRRRLGLQ